MMVKDAMTSKDIMLGIIPINSVNAYVLFNLGVTRSFISHDFAHRLNLFSEDLEYPLIIDVTNKEVIPMNHVHRNYCIKIRG